MREARPQLRVALKASLAERVQADELDLIPS